MPGNIMSKSLWEVVEYTFHPGQNESWVPEFIKLSERFGEHRPRGQLEMGYWVAELRRAPETPKSEIRFHYKGIDLLRILSNYPSDNDIARTLVEELRKIGYDNVEFVQR